MKKYFLSIMLLTLCVAIVSSCVKYRSTPPVVIPPVNTSNDTLIYYWNFNTDTIHYLIPNVAIVSGASLSYAGAYADSVQPGSIVNAVGADTVLTSYSAALRLRNPAGAFTLTLPTTGYKNIVLKYAEDHTSKGATVNTVTYTVDGVNWINTAISATATYTVDSLDTNNGFQLISFDFSSDSSVNNNPNFAVQINFGAGGTNTSGNDRIDNITLYGVAK